MTTNEMNTELHEWATDLGVAEFGDFEQATTTFEDVWTYAYDEDGLPYPEKRHVEVEGYVAYQKEGRYGIFARVSEDEDALHTTFSLSYAEDGMPIGGIYEDIHDAVAQVARLEKQDVEDAA